MGNLHRALRALAAGVALLVIALPVAAPAAPRSFGPFRIDDTGAGAIVLDGPIALDSALDFHRAIQADPQAHILVLNSPGGLVQIALVIAEDVYERKMATYIPADAECYSACAFVFFAGAARRDDGKLGVHQVSAVVPDTANSLISAQSSISDILEVLNRFDTPIGVMTVMLKTPPDQIHVFAPDEIAEYGINRDGSAAPLSAASPPSAQAQAQAHAPAPAEAETAAGRASADAPPPAAVAGPSPATPSTDPFSTLRDFAHQPTRLAVFAGIDFFGNDLASHRTADAAGCAQACMTLGAQCRAFTFNLDPRITRGPNCFLKSAAGRRDGNAVAISGLMLGRADPDPGAFTIGVIDPKGAVFDKVDLPGGDLSNRPFSRRRTAQDCRLACIDDARCVAFTYVRSRSECWLKGQVGAPRSSVGMVSGVKDIKTFPPARIISLQ